MAAATGASAALAAPRIWLEYADLPEALMVSNDSGADVRGCKVEWRVRYENGAHYAEIALADLPANGSAKVSDCRDWWDPRRSRTFDVRLALFGPNGAVLARKSYVGVFKIVTRTGIPTDGWSARASRGPHTVAAYDGDLRTRWDTGGRQRLGDWFLLDMGRTHRVSGVILDARYSANDYPSGLRVSASEDERKWSVLADIEDTEPLNQGGRLTVKFEPVSARYIRLELTRPHGNRWFWSIHELSVLPAEGQ